MNLSGNDIVRFFFLILFALTLIALWVFTYLQLREKRRRADMIHQERMAAMEKGIPLPEFPNFNVGPSPFLTARLAAKPNPQASLLTGIIFLCVSVGTMMALFTALPAGTHSYWILPLPLAFVGIGLLLYYFWFTAALSNTGNMVSDTTLIEAYRERGDEIAFAELVRRY